MGQVMMILPLPRGTRQMVRQLGQVKYLCSLSALRARPFLMGFTILLRNQAFSLRRLGRFRENIRKIVHTIKRKTTVDRIVWTVSLLYFTNRFTVEHQQQHQRCPAQLVGAVAPVHKAGKRVAQFLEETHSVASIPAGNFSPALFYRKRAAR